MNRIRTAVGPALVLLVVALVYWPGRTGGFLFDDFLNIADNRDVQITAMDVNSLVKAASASPVEGSGRQLSFLTLGMNFALTGIDPVPFKLTNVAIHLIAVMLVFFLARAIYAALRDTGHKAPDREHTVIYALMVMAVFAIHPMQLTSVLYIVQRMTSLAGIFTFAGILAYIMARRRVWRGEGSHGSTLFLFMVPVACTLAGALAKENGILLPLFALVIEAIIFRFRNEKGDWDRRIIAWHGVLTVLPALVAVAWLALDPQRFLLGYASRDFTLAERLLTEARVVAFYLKNLVAPSVSALGLYHDDISISRSFLQPPATLAAIGLIAGLVSFAWYVRNRAPLVSLGIFFFFAGHVMESTILPLEIAHEHRNYVPLFGFALATAGLVQHVESPTVPRWLPRAAMFAFVGVLGVTTWLRSIEWSNPVDHAESEIRHHPQSSRANYDAGRLYGSLNVDARPEFANRAIELFLRAAQLDANSTLPLVSAIATARKAGIAADARWLGELEDRYRHGVIDGSSTIAIRYLARSVRENPLLAHADMIAILEAASANPSLAQFPRHRANIAAVYGEYLANSIGDVTGAEKKFRDSVAALPEAGQYRVNLIIYLLKTGRPNDAASELRSLRDISGSGISSQSLAMLEADVATARGQFNRESTVN